MMRNVNGEVISYWTFYIFWHTSGLELYLLYHVDDGCPIGVSVNHVDVEVYDGYHRTECPVCCIGAADAPQD